jgi:hypothetical protein
VTFRDPSDAAREMCRSLAAKISAKQDAIDALKSQLSRAEDQLDHFLLIRPKGSLLAAAVLGTLLGIVTQFFLR